MSEEKSKQLEIGSENTPAKTPEKKEIAVSKEYKLVAAAKSSFEKGNAYQMDFAREANFAVQILESNSYLAGCTPASIRNAIINVSMTGITLNPALKFAYLVPRSIKDQRVCVLDISYMGMIKILTDAGAVKSVDANVVYENDTFTYSQGSEPFLEFQRKLGGKKGNPIGAYAIAYFRDGGSQFIIMDKDEIEAVRATSESYKNEKGRQYSPWEKWTDEMWKKTAFKRLFKILPKTDFSDQLISALSNDHLNEVEDTAEEDKYKGKFEGEFDEYVEVKEEKEGES